MSPADSADGGPLRVQFGAELEQLALQVEVMGVIVEENLAAMREVLRTGDENVADTAVLADDRIDAMNVSLTERCYELLRREAPVAADLRLIVSVLRVTAELERIGDLSLRVVKLAPDHEVLRSVPAAYAIIAEMADAAIELYCEAMEAWATRDPERAEAVAVADRKSDATGRLVAALLANDAPDAVAAALRTMVAGQALDRISDHAVILGARVRYLITGDPAHLAAEVR